MKYFQNFTQLSLAQILTGTPVTVLEPAKVEGVVEAFGNGVTLQSGNVFVPKFDDMESTTGRRTQLLADEFPGDVSANINLYAKNSAGEWVADANGRTATIFYAGQLWWPVNEVAFQPTVDYKVQSWTTPSIDSLHIMTTTGVTVVYARFLGLSQEDDDTYIPIVQPLHIGDGVQTTFNAPHSDSSPASSFLVNVDGFLQIPYESYTSSPGQIVFSEAPPLNSSISITFYRPVSPGSLPGTDVSESVATSSEGNTSRTISERLSEVVNVKDFGAVGDGITDDTIAIQSAMDVGGIVVFPGGVYRTTSSIILNNPVVVDFMGSTIKGDSNSQTSAWFYVRADNCSFTNGLFESDNGGQPFNIGDWDNRTSSYSNITFRDLLFRTGTIPDNHGLITIIGVQVNVVVDNCKFYSTVGRMIGSGNCVQLSLDGSGSTVDDEISLRVTNCVSNGIPKLFDNWSAPYASDVLIQDNVIRSGAFGVRPYHVYNCLVSGNIFEDLNDTIYVWQRTQFVNNQIDDSGDGFTCVRIETPDSTVISNNRIRKAKGHGMVCEGGESSTHIEGNSISESSLSGIYVNPEIRYGGQISSLVLSNNYIYGNFSHGVEIEVGGNIRNMAILNNYIAGNASGNPVNKAGVYVNFSVAGKSVDGLLIKGNTFRKNDVVYGIQDSNTEWAVYVEANSNIINPSMEFHENYCDTPKSFWDERADGGGYISVINNRVLDNGYLVGYYISRGISRYDGNFEVRNGSDGFTQKEYRFNSGSPIGSLTPNYLGEMVYDRINEIWYIGIGSHRTGWTSSDWTPLTS